MFKKNKKRGQSTLEYLVLVAMVIAVLIVFLRPGGCSRTRIPIRFNREQMECRQWQTSCQGLILLRNSVTCYYRCYVSKSSFNF